MPIPPLQLFNPLSKLLANNPEDMTLYRINLHADEQVLVLGGDKKDYPDKIRQSQNVILWFGNHLPEKSIKAQACLRLVLITTGYCDECARDMEKSCQHYKISIMPCDLPTPQIVKMLERWIKSLPASTSQLPIDEQYLRRIDALGAFVLQYTKLEKKKYHGPEQIKAETIRLTDILQKEHTSIPCRLDEIEKILNNLRKISDLADEVALRAQDIIVPPFKVDSNPADIVAQANVETVELLKGLNGLSGQLSFMIQDYKRLKALEAEGKLKTTTESIQTAS